MSSVSKSDAEKLIAEARTRIHQRRTEIALTIEEKNNEYRTAALTALKPHKLKGASFLGEHYFKKYTTNTTTRKIKKNQRLEKEYVPKQTDLNTFNHENQINMNLEEPEPSIIKESQNKKDIHPEKQENPESIQNKDKQAGVQKEKYFEEESLAFSHPTTRQMCKDQKILENNVNEVCQKNFDEIIEKKINEVCRKNIEILEKEASELRNEVLILEEVLSDHLDLEPKKHENFEEHQISQLEENTKFYYESKTSEEEEILPITRCVETNAKLEEDEILQDTVKSEERGPETSEEIIQLEFHMSECKEEENFELLGQNNSPDELSIPEFTPNKPIPAANESEQNVEIVIKINSKTVQHKYFIMVDDIKLDGIGEIERNQKTIIQRRNKSVDSFTSTYLESPRFSYIESICELASDSDSSASSYHTASSSSFAGLTSSELTSSKSPDLGDEITNSDQIENQASAVLRIRDNFKVLHEEQPTINQLPLASAKEFKQRLEEFSHPVYEVQGEMEYQIGSNEEPVNNNRSRKQQRSSHGLKKRSIYEFVRPVCGQIYEMENTNVLLED